MLLIGAEEASTTGEVILGFGFLAYGALWLISLPVCIAKGKIGPAIFGFFFGLLLGGIVSIIAAFRLAKPDSWWAQQYYDADKTREARERHGATARDVRAGAEPAPAGAGASGSPAQQPRPLRSTARAPTTVKPQGPAPTPSREAGEAKPAKPSRYKSDRDAEAEPVLKTAPAAASETASETKWGGGSKGTPGGWQCMICGEPFPSKSAALGHAKSTHKGVNPETSIGQT